MSTEKSLLTYESMMDSIRNLTKNVGGIQMPLGVTPGGSLERVFLRNDSENANALICGVTGSGKTKYVEFIVKSLCDLYGSGLRISYIDGKDCEVKQWQGSETHKCRIPNPGILTSCRCVEQFTDIIGHFCDVVNNYNASFSELVVFDDVGYLVNELDERAKNDFSLMLRSGPSVGIHFVFAQQLASGLIFDFGKYFDLICTTRVGSKVSNELYGSLIGTSVRKYGDVVYSYCGNQSKLRVPFVETMH